MEVILNAEQWAVVQFALSGLIYLSMAVIVLLSFIAVNMRPHD